MNRRYLSRYRKYPYPGAVNHTAEASDSSIQEIIKKIEDIPLPNQKESTPDPGTRFGRPNRPAKSGRFPLEGIFNRIGLEEVILFGLILLLLDEGIEDDFLLIMLVYILISGFE